MPFMPTKEAKMRYRRRGAPAIVIVIGTFYGVHWVFDRYHPSEPWAIFLALLQPLSLIVLATFIVQFLNEDRDEVQMAYRRHAVSWATAGLLAVSLCWNQLGVYKLAGAREVAPGMAIPVFVGFLIVALLALKRRYQ